jgi:hypothetical protein
MNKKTITVVSSIIISMTASSFVLKYSTGIAGYTGSPGEGTCSGCHGASSGTTTIGISSTPSFSGNIFNPGATYTINISVANSDFSRFGFGCEILNEKDSSTGIMSSPLAGVQFINAFNGRENATHTSMKSGIGSAIFSFVWIAPQSDSVWIYASGNAVNNDGNSTGDNADNSFLALVSDGTVDLAERQNKKSFEVNIFPNPSSEGLNFEYFMANSSVIRSVLCDLHGKEVKELFNERQAIGFHKYRSEFSSKVANGVYVLRITIDGKLSAQKLVIIR